MATSENSLRRVADYYETQLSGHGETAQGTGWNGSDAQRVRFVQLGKLLPTEGHFSVNDLGCGYGAFVDFLDEQRRDFDYLGCDIAAQMIQTADARYPGRAGVAFEVGAQPSRVADYSIASGIFNVHMDCPPAEWEAYIEASIAILDRSSRLGFAFNCLTSYSDPEKMSPKLYYGDPCHYFDLCKKRYARDVALLHDYGIYDFTIIVRKPAA